MHHAPPVHPLLARFFCFFKCATIFILHAWKWSSTYQMKNHRKCNIVGWALEDFSFFISAELVLNTGWMVPLFFAYGANQFKYVQLIIQETVSVSLTLWCLNLWETFCKQKNPKMAMKKTDIHSCFLSTEKQQERNSDFTCSSV